MGFASGIRHKCRFLSPFWKHLFEFGTEPVRRRASCDTERASPHGRSQRPPHPGVAGSTSPSASPALIQLSLLRGPLMETSLRPSAFRQLVWRASASSAGLLEDLRLTLYYAPRRQGPFAATWDITCQFGGGGSQVSRQQGWRRLRRLAVITPPQARLVRKSTSAPVKYLFSARISLGVQSTHSHQSGADPDASNGAQKSSDRRNTLPKAL